MMRSLGHDVFLYASEDSDADAELITCITKDEQRQLFGPVGSIPSYDPNHPGFRLFNERAIANVRERAAPGDFLCLGAGFAQKPIADAFPNMFDVEFGIGYEGVFARFRVYESYAWMHAVEGRRLGATAANGRFYDAVVPNYFTPSEFPRGSGSGGYLLFLGRLIERKGLHIVCEVAKRTGIKTVVAGAHADGLWDRDFCDAGIEYVGPVGPEDRARLLGGAVALLSPSLYLEPFGGSAVEAQLTGTPAITTDWGAYPETVVQGLTGYRCRDLGEFCWAAKNAHLLDRTLIRRRALARYSTDAVRHEYAAYFDRLRDLTLDGFYTTRERAPGAVG